MNEGIIASRYARALLKLTAESGRGKEVFAQVDGMLDSTGSIPDVLETDLAALITLLEKNERENLLKRVMIQFRKFYCRQEGISIGRLTTAVKDEALELRMKALGEKMTGGSVLMKSLIDPGIEGGFKFEIDGLMMDASVRTQLETIRKELTESNRRLV
ncbi:MAG: F0F1 ATP synthase subunit delta [Bacteroidales bacterium]|nr:F0F1 ATP synthase subunit delta [Bacteroidales bacterium]